MKKKILPELTVCSKINNINIIIDKETTRNFQNDIYLLWNIDDSKKSIESFSIEAKAQTSQTLSKRKVSFIV